VAFLGATLVKNARIGDVNDVIRAEVDARLATLDLSPELRLAQLTETWMNFSNWLPAMINESEA
jgi:hypothetical protein